MQGNPILNQLNRQRNNSSKQMPQIQPYKNMMRQIQNSANPQSALENMLMQNSNLQQISQLLKMNNGNLQQLAQFIANQRGYDLNAIIAELQK